LSIGESLINNHFGLKPDYQDDLLWGVEKDLINRKAREVKTLYSSSLRSLRLMDLDFFNSPLIIRRLRSLVH